MKNLGINSPGYEFKRGQMWLVSFSRGGCDRPQIVLSQILDLIKVLSGNRDIFPILGQTEGIAAEFCINALNLCAVHNGCPVTTNEAGIWF
jgi:hypothetical protein